MVPYDVATRVRGEYSEMPGLRLTLTQACKLWQVDAVVCEAVLKRLVDEGFLFRTADGAFMMFPSVRPRPVKATLVEAATRRPA